MNECISEQKNYTTKVFEVLIAQKPRFKPRPPFWIPMVVIFDFAGFVALQVGSKFLRNCKAGISTKFGFPPFLTLANGKDQIKTIQLILNAIGCKLQKWRVPHLGETLKFKFADI